MFVVEDIRQAAEDTALALTLAGYRADFRPSSLWEIDRLFAEADRDLDQVIDDPHGLGHALFAVGGYVGEVIRRRLGGTWIGDDDDPDAEVNVSLCSRTAPSFGPCNER
jgi:hypothetical protein